MHTNTTYSTIQIPLFLNQIYMGITLAYVLAPVYLMVGLSVLLHAKAWQNLLGKWQKDHLLLFPLMFMYAILGMVIILLHNIWVWDVYIIATLTGWIMLVKAVLYFLLPGSVLKPMLNVKKELGLLYVGGLIAIIVGAVLGYYAYIA